MNAESNLIPLLNTDEEEVNRQLQICNACRYCEGYCAVFPAMTQRLEFGKADIHYLANLCHNCGACLHACQYADPHEFGVNIPKSMAKVRLQTYSDYAWPRKLGALYQRNGLTLALSSALALGLFLVLTLLVQGSLFSQIEGGDFYQIFPHNTLVAMFGSVFGFSTLALILGVVHFWRKVAPGEKQVQEAVPAMIQTGKAALTLKYLDGGHGQGCNNEDDAFTLARRRFHHLTFYGFMLCFAATSVATLYHYVMGWEAPYPIFSVPVILGIVGGIGLLIGPAGLFYLNYKRHPEHGDQAQRPMDRGFIMLLFMISLTGLLLLGFRETTLMPLMLALHLGFVMAFFLTMPYSKFAHGFYRSAALFKSYLETRKNNNSKH
ncbi:MULTISPECIES: tricarballylate utilization 4Fe-4S protein TcuB [Marinobacterium]|uniref:Citrate/tricarballylate utilization protein n=1 Tax=Marinobacterium iners DSM 11526 TaxID=1122198 RepID=A0A1H4FR46_9GAMM|nr:tricarballylate utilization 4Fe-4S protein TcuB [Marinobacterium iners]SEA99158.1 citrate/tricarballylate utilization protein [Marinobacterium iners DSM 11526]